MTSIFRDLEWPDLPGWSRAGAIHNPYTAYDGAGYATVSVTDTRTSIGGRMSFYGLYLVAEFLSRQQLDSMSASSLGSGWYGQAGWHLPMGLEPMFRMGTATIDESFDPQTLTRWLDLGLNYYPALKAKRADQVKITLHYLSPEHRIDESAERAQGISSRVQGQLLGWHQLSRTPTWLAWVPMVRCASSVPSLHPHADIALAGLDDGTPSLDLCRSLLCSRSRDSRRCLTGPRRRAPSSISSFHWR